MVGDTGSETLFQMVADKRHEYREAMRRYLHRRFPELQNLEDGEVWTHRDYLTRELGRGPGVVAGG